MKSLLILTLLLTGCATVTPVTQHFPDVPADLLTPAEELTTLDKPNPELSDLLENDNANYGKHRELKSKYEAWQEWYKQQKQIFDKVN